MPLNAQQVPCQLSENAPVPLRPAGILGAEVTRLPILRRNRPIPTCNGQRTPTNKAVECQRRATLGNRG